ncbi:MAG TPA: circularly permuted type 2 ATP-grasp protein [Solirubrobacterales bacterium]|jgi:carboxylate-amine ligase|nr:circularly permuted type 2 ATP-grasp protein [Solirubrobacterales bacterium]
MATTLNPARPFPGAGVYPLDSGHFDEAFAETGTARPPYATVIDALARHDLVELRERVRSNVETIGLSFGPGVPMVVDPVPRVIDAAEWEALEAGLLQRARALNAFLRDAYGDQRIFEEGIVPRRLLETSQGYEPLMRGLLDPEVPPATVAGMDLIRDADGELLVLEDNLRMPSGATYAIAVREAVGPELGAEATTGLCRPDGYVERLGEAIRAAAPAPHADEPVAAILSDGPESGAWYEHERLGRELSLPVVTPDRLSQARGRLHARIGRGRVQLDVVYRRLDADRLSDRGGALTELGRLLAPALESGRLRCVNAIGTGLADDKLAHAYVEAMVRFYLSEEPKLRSVPSYDLSDPAARDEVMGRLDELVVKPRDGFGGHGVTIMPRSTESERRKVIGLVRRRPERFVAQELVPLSTHPTVVGAGIAPRRVDLRPYVLSPAAGEPSVMQGGLTRYAKAAEEMVVNSSQGGGSKDTWVLGPATDVV